MIGLGPPGPPSSDSGEPALPDLPDLPDLPGIPDLADLDLDLIDSLADGIPDNLLDAERQLAPALAEFLDAEAAQVVLPLLILAVLALLGGLIRRLVTAPSDSSSPGPPASAAALICVGLYLLGRIFDPLLASLLTRPEWFPAARWAEVGWFEWKLLGRPWAWGALPLADHPGLALLVHAVVWGGAWLVIRSVLDWIWATGLRWSEPTRDLPAYFRWVGASTTRRADQRFRRWLGIVLSTLVPLHALAGMRLAENPGASPAPGAWITAGLLLWTTLFHLLVTGKEPAPGEDGKSEGDEDEEDEGTLAAPRVPQLTPLQHLRAAVESLRPGFELEALEVRAPNPGQRAPFPPMIAPLVREIFEDLTGQTQPWRHQAELLTHLGELWRIDVGPDRGEVPNLEEEQAAKGIRQADTSTPHALVLAAEGSGRTTSTLLAALHVYFDRGATSLVVVRDPAAARRWASTLAQALAGSSARWNVLVCVAGRDLAQALVADRTPAVVVTDLESCESEILCDPRTDAFLARLGLVIVDDVDAFTGVAEMHLQLCVRRLWALLDRLHEAPYPPALLATAGRGASGMDAWARHVLAQPMRLFAADTAQTRAQVILRRRDLVDGSGADIPLTVLAQACDRAGLPWHLRQAGDQHRGVRRAAFDLGDLRRHHRDDPREAAIVIVEGTYPGVRREAQRLTHAGVAVQSSEREDGATRTDTDRERSLNTGLNMGLNMGPDAPIVLVLAPPGDEEMVLHEEAEDAAHRELVASLPRAVPLSEPRVVRQRHFDRALGREQDLEALRERFGARFVDDTIASLGDALRHREVLHIDPERDEIAPKTLIQAVKEGALGQPIDAACVSDRGSRATVVDAGTSEVLLTTDRAVARALYPPGSIFLHPRGRYMVVDHHGERRAEVEAGEITAEQIGGRERSSADRSLSAPALALPLSPAHPSPTPPSPTPPSPTPLGPDWADRQFGGRTLPVALVNTAISEHLHGMRRFAPGPTLVDHRVYERPFEVRYGTDVCLVATGADPRRPLDPERADRLDREVDSDLGPEREPDMGALVPLTAALRMVLPCYLRASAELVDVGIIDYGGHRLLCFFDRTPGASGFARYICERGLKELLILARLVLERLVGPEFVRLRHIHDRSPDMDPSSWRISDALRWLDAVLTPLPPGDDGETRDEPSDAHGSRVVYTPGEGRGDLGRLWISKTGRSDDLVWTRHSWWSPLPIAGQPKGKVSFDVAVERPAIAAAQRRARALAGSSPRLPERLDLDSSRIHARLIAAERTDLEPIRDQLQALSGDALVDTVIALVTAIPLSPRTLDIAERGPLAVLARRRADLDAKLLLACALLPASARPEIVVGPPPEEAGWLRIEGPGPERGTEVWDLRGPRPKLIAEAPAQRVTLILDGLDEA